MFNYYPLSYSSTIDVYPIELVEVNSIAVEEENLGPASEEILNESKNNWRIVLGGNLKSALKIAGRERKSRQIFFNINGLMEEFSSLKTLNDIETFSMKYGLLGIQHPENAQVNSLSPAVKFTLQPSFIFNNYGFSVLEPIQVWQWHINQVRKILRLYHAVRKASSDELIYEIVEIKMRRGMVYILTEDKEVTDRYFVHWRDGEEILMLPESFESKPTLEIAQYTLAKILESHLSDGINLSVGDLISNPTTKGFMITEQRYTRYLLAAVYYDLWQTINDSKNVFLCENKNCRLPLVKYGRKKYCNEACKQEAYRIRISEKEGEG
ncbi:hypothetical protein [Peribacillus sp. V2I11]|uniref:hypothetical protein n=1 Tax=Peribacillus sp. V2I11 TaxID=3042277 RepID=UPI00278B30B2|nr:hypothetical protein [Peribacillus sp. V2I11]MDQ0880965.1 hypothetical protein [Peribacillus sp. V2I11]